MFRHISARAIVTLVLVGAVSSLMASHFLSLAGEQRVKVGEYQLSGPYAHDNLTLVLIHGEDQLKGRSFLMLAEALEQKKFVIHETQKVNELAMENLSDREVVILSGDILKGGQQDRIAQNDQIVPPKKGKLPLQVFCVERTASRWMKPLTDEDKTFTSSPGQLCTNDLRLACRKDNDQSGVWKNVMGAQDKLTANLKVDVKAKESDSSLALSLQVKAVEEAIGKYVGKLSALLDNKADVVGYAFAINGKVLSADVYGSPALFRKVWPRLLRASAIEAVTELTKEKKFPAQNVQAFATFMEEANKGKVTSQDAAKGLRQTTNDAARVLRFETTDPSGKMMLRKHQFTY
jgi:hypothetical protein